MLKLLHWCVALIAVTFFTTVFAVDESAQSQEFMQALEAKTELSSEQKAEMKKIITRSIEQREAIIAKYKGQKGLGVKRKIRDDLQNVNESTRAEVQKVLDEEQYEMFLTVQEAQQEKLRERINSEF